jgi:hypothetical protein
VPAGQAAKQAVTEGRDVGSALLLTDSPDERGVPTPRVRPWVPTSDVISLTAAAREQQLRQQQQRTSREEWERATQKAEAELRKADAPLLRAARLEAAEREPAELKGKKQGAVA